MTKDELLKAAKWARPALANSRPLHNDKETDDELWRSTMEEVENKECRGPYSAEDLDKMFPGGWIAAKRFAVKQKGKVRPCDDYSKYGQNATSSAKETIDPDSPDAIIGSIRLWEGALRSGRRVVLYLADGTRLEGTLHASLSRKETRKLRARLVDL
jgi:hypothetical protein